MAGLENYKPYHGRHKCTDVDTAVDLANDLQSQVDQIVIEASQESVVAPEVAQARVNAKGDSFNTLKSRLDKSDSTVTSGFGEIRTDGEINLFNVDTVVDNVFLNGTTGAESEDVKYNASDFIPVDAETTYTIKTFEYTDSASYRLYYYDDEKNFISRTTSRVSDSPNGFVFTTPASSAFCRLNFETVENTGGTQDEGTCVLEKGNTTISEYTPYHSAFDRFARKRIGDVLLKFGTTLVNHGTDYSFTNMNDVGVNTIYYTSSSRVTTNYPNGITAGYTITIGINTSNRIQLVYGARADSQAMRACVSGTWGDWVYPVGADTTIINHGTDYSFTDMNDVPGNTIYYTSSNIVTTNYPSGFGAAYVVTVALNASNKIQIVYGARADNKAMRACVGGTWGDWQYQITEESIMSKIYATSTIAMFENVGCCGDSFTAGYLYNKTDSQWYDPSYVPNGEYPLIGYPAVMGRMYGVNVTSFAKGGLTSGAWRTDPKGLPALLAADPQDLYIIALGLNDKTQQVPVGVVADIDTEPQEETALGNFGAIIRAIQTHAPNAKIILVKSLWVYNAGGSAYNDYYDYISGIVETLSDHLDIPYIETLGDPYFSSSGYVNGLKGLHPTAPLYAGIGKRMGELVGDCIFNNPDYFYNYYKVEQQAGQQ